MKSRYLLSSLGIHLVLAALLTPLVLQLPREDRQQAAFVELQKVSDNSVAFLKKNRLKPIVVTAKDADDLEEPVTSNRNKRADSKT